MTDLDFSRCRSVWVPDGSEAGGFWSPPPEHVKVGVRFIVEHPYCMVGDAMGGMKTAQALIAAQFLHDANLIDRLIVVAPASVVPKVWFDQDLGQVADQLFECKRALVSHYHARVRQWARGPERARELRVICTNYEFIRNAKNLAPLLPYCGPRTMLVLDESSAVRSYDSQQTEACMALRWLTNARGRPVYGQPRCGRVVELNGTPVAETPMDLFSQANLLHPSILDCRYVTHFRARYAVQQPVMERGKAMVRHGKAVQEVVGWTPEGVADLQRRMAPYVLRREAKEFGVDFALPPVGHDVQLTTDTWKLYRDMRDEMVAWLKSGVATAQQAGVKAIRLAQITSGLVGGVTEDPALDVGDLETLWDDASQNIITRQLCDPLRVEPVQFVGREKLDAALELQAEWLRRDPRLKLLAWVRFVPELRRYLGEVKERFGHEVGAACGQKVLDNEMTRREEREHALRLLHPRTAPAGAATVGATQGTGAMGLNFTACRTVLDVSYDASAFKKRQGDARTNRTGQTGPVSYHYLVAVGPRGQKTVDHHTMLARLGKMNLADLTVAGWVRVLTEE